MSLNMETKTELEIDGVIGDLLTLLNSRSHQQEADNGKLTSKIAKKVKDNAFKSLYEDIHNFELRINIAVVLESIEKAKASNDLHGELAGYEAELKGLQEMCTEIFTGTA
jgi:hypothetical protein